MKNPFNFRHFYLVDISMYSDGQQQYGMKLLTTDFTNNLYLIGFNTLFSGIGKLFRDEGNAISRESFESGYALYAFDLRVALHAGHLVLWMSETARRVVDDVRVVAM